MRSSGILCAISSLPSPYGIGSLGKVAYDFIDFLKASKQKYWQVLPIVNTSFGDSPYQSVSTFAGGINYIDLDLLVEDGYLNKVDVIGLTENVTVVDYGKLYLNRYAILKVAYKNFCKNLPNDYFSFIKENNYWLNDFSLYMSIKKHFNEASFDQWPKAFKLKEEDVINTFIDTHQDEIDFWNFTQYIFFNQWNKLKLYANASNIRLIGDLPIYVAYDSCDVWGNPKLFDLDENLVPKKVAGVPPDYFSETGQLWGNPLYNYQEMEKDNFSWWINRLRHFSKVFDYIRLDHFRGFEAYYTIPYGNKTAIDGAWVKGPGMKLFNQVFKELKDINLIAEDLGFLTEEVYELLRETKLPGMKIMEFGFDVYGDSDHAPHNYKQHMVAYPGTHDNDTIKGWYDGLDDTTKNYVKDYLNVPDDLTIVDDFIKTIFASSADLVIVQLQDHLGLDNSARMNEPGVLGNNWKWRVKQSDLSLDLIEKIKKITEIYRR
ncbi:MAG: 4-alpha-glucanotransferase [Bacilli bacterium]|nr:4-alpha-glucanotransferase [Bacilli bacterium]